MSRDIYKELGIEVYKEPKLGFADTIPMDKIKASIPMIDLILPIVTGKQIGRAHV